MDGDERLRAELSAAVSGPGTVQRVADRLCEACVQLLDVDAASLSLTVNGANRGTLGASGAASRHLDKLQFTFGEGLCLDAVHDGSPVLVADLDDPAETRWPAFTDAVLRTGFTAVFALPVSLASARVGALDLFRRRQGRLTGLALAGGLLAAELEALPLLDLLAARTVNDEPGPDGPKKDDVDGWTQLASLDRIEVYQATGMLMGALGVDEVEALARLRAHAYASGRTAAQLAAAIVERTVLLNTPDWHHPHSSAEAGR